MRVRASERRRGLDGGTTEDAPGRLRPARPDPPRDDDRPDDAVWRRQRRGDDLRQAVGAADAAGDPVRDLRRRRRTILDRVFEVGDRERGRMVGDPDPRADEVRGERPAVLGAPDDDDVVGPGRVAQLLDDGVDDRIR
jgi:hypothetical protein